MSEEQIAWTKALEHKCMELIQALVREGFTEADWLKETLEEMERHARSRGWKLNEHCDSSAAILDVYGVVASTPAFRFRPQGASLPHARARYRAGAPVSYSAPSRARRRGTGEIRSVTSTWYLSHERPSIFVGSQCNTSRGS